MRRPTRLEGGLLTLVDDSRGSNGRRTSSGSRLTELVSELTEQVQRRSVSPGLLPKVPDRWGVSSRLARYSVGAGGAGFICRELNVSNVSNSTHWLDAARVLERGIAVKKASKQLGR